MRWSASLAWRIEFEDAAKKELSRLDQQAARRIIAFLRDRLAPLDDPRALGGPLKGSRLGELWKYRVGDYRIITHIEDRILRVLVVKTGNRRDVYRK